VGAIERLHIVRGYAVQLLGLNARVFVIHKH